VSCKRRPAFRAGGEYDFRSISPNPQIWTTNQCLAEEQISRLDEEIVQHIKTHGLEKPDQVLQTNPGVKEEATSLLAEFGPDMGVFGNAKHLKSQEQDRYLSRPTRRLA
jgi:hypothetical protein